MVKKLNEESLRQSMRQPYTYHEENDIAIINTPSSHPSNTTKPAHESHRLLTQPCESRNASQCENQQHLISA